MSDLFVDWSWSRPLPAPFDSYLAGHSRIQRKDVTSRYNAGPRKVSTIHPLVMRAVQMYMNLDLGNIPATQRHKGALGSRSNTSTIAEYPSTSGEVHVVNYNRNNGQFKAGRYLDPIVPTGKPESYPYTEEGPSGSALFFALLPEEEATIPILPSWYIIPPEIKQICEHAQKTTGSHAMRNFLLRGPAGTGKSEGAKAIAAAMHLPYRFLTCSAGTEIFDLIGQIMPAMNPKPKENNHWERPTFMDIQMDPASVHYPGRHFLI